MFCVSDNAAVETKVEDDGTVKEETYVVVENECNISQGPQMIAENECLVVLSHNLQNVPILQDEVSTMVL